MKLRDLSPADWKNLGEYIATIKSNLYLDLWAISLSHRPCKKRYAATIAPVYGRMLATINLSRNWPTFTPAEQKQTIVHELLHLHFWHAQRALARLEDIAPENVFHLVWEGHLEALEYGIDNTSVALARAFPDPPIITGE